LTHVENALPPIDDDFLCDCLLGAGPIENTGFGAISISPQRLEAWMRITGFALSPWQAEVIMRASKAYANQMHSDANAAPWSAEGGKADAARLIKSALRSGRQG
jgi:hypothetical protein